MLRRILRGRARAGHCGVSRSSSRCRTLLALRAQEAPGARLGRSNRDTRGLRPALRRGGRARRQNVLGQGAAGSHRVGAPARRRLARASSRLPASMEAARRINALLDELKTSHTALLTPDDVDYYILLDGLSGRRCRRRTSTSASGAGVTLRRHRHLLGAHRGARLRRRLTGGIAGRSCRPEGRATRSSASMARRITPSARFAARSASEVAVAVRRTDGGPIEIASRQGGAASHRCDAFRRGNAVRARASSTGRAPHRLRARVGLGRRGLTLQRCKNALSSLGDRSERPSRSKGDKRPSPPLDASDRRYARQDRRHGQYRQALSRPARSPRSIARFARQVSALARRHLAARTHRRSHQPSYAKHGGAVRPRLQA